MLAIEPIWSRDGKYIYFTGYREANYKENFPMRIYRVNYDGTGLIYITKGEEPNV